MNKKSNDANIMISGYKIFALLFIILFIGGISLIPNILREYSSGWLRGEFYLDTISQILFLIGIYFYSKRNLISPYWQRKYVINFFVGAFLLFYAYGSMSYDASFPTLGALFIYSIVFFFIMSIIDLIITLTLPRNTHSKSL